MQARPTYLQLLGGVKTALELLRLNQIAGFAGSPAGELAFNAVRVYAHESIEAAIKDARLFKNRLAFIVPTERKFENQSEGRVLKSRQTLGFILLLADRNYGDRTVAVTGNSTTPGIIALSELVLEHLIGSNLGLVGVCLVPGGGEPFTLTAEERDELVGREVWAQEFSTGAGSFVVERARPGTT